MLSILVMAHMSSAQKNSMKKKHLDELMVELNLAQSRSQATKLIKLGKVYVGHRKALRPEQMASKDDSIRVKDQERYVSRSGFKLSSANSVFNVPFEGKVVLDVGSSTGGFTDYALQNGAKKVIAVDIGTEQLHPTLRPDPRIELHEKTDIRGFKPAEAVDIVVIDVSFISMRDVLPSTNKMISPKTSVLAMLKPQFEAGDSAKIKGIIKNSKIRRAILQNFELWAKAHWFIAGKVDSEVAGTKGNEERFYLLKKL